MCQVWLLGASLGWLHLILQVRGLSRTHAASDPTDKYFLTFALSVPFVCNAPPLVLPHPSGLSSKSTPRKVFLNQLCKWAPHFLSYSLS